MIACVYGASAAPFIAATVDNTCRAFARLHLEMRPLTIEQAIEQPPHPGEFSQLYVFPFEVPDDLPDSLPSSAAELLHALFPGAEVLNSLAAHQLCSDKVAATQRLLERGVAIPETLSTNSAREAIAFIRANDNAILKQTHASAATGHLVVACDSTGTIIGEVRGRRYVLELEDSGIGRRLAHGVLTCPPPFFLQRMITTTRRDGVLAPAQVLRAYLLDGAIPFWTEFHLPRAQRPADFILGPRTGARLRFLQVVSHAADLTARRAADVLGVRFGAVDMIRSDYEGLYVLGAVTDGPEAIVDRHFKDVPEYRDAFDFDQHLAQTIAADLRARAAEAVRRTR